MSSSPIVIRAKMASHCPHCHLPVEIGEPIAPVEQTWCSHADYGWEHAFHHTRSFNAAEAWGLYDEERQRDAASAAAAAARV